MASECFIIANDNVFNKAVLKKNALYFKDSADVKNLLDNIYYFIGENRLTFLNGNIQEIKKEYSWEHLVDEHEKYFKWLLEQK